MQALSDWISKYSSLPGREVFIYNETEDAVVYEIINQKEGSNIGDILMNIYPKRKGVPLSYLNKYILSSLLFFVLMVLNKPLNAQNEIAPIIILQSSSDEFSVEVTNELIEAFKYPEFKYEIIDLDITENISIDKKTNLLINTSSNITSIDDRELNKIIDYLGKGGKMIFLVR